MIGKVLGIAILAAVGVTLTAQGFLLWKKERITLLHGYHADRVAPENRKAFCTLSGIGLITAGAGLLITAALLGVTDSAGSFLCFAVCFAAGLSMLIAAGRKYNR